MKRKIITAIAAFSMIMTSVSCGDDFVEVDPYYTIDSDNYFNSEEDYYRALVGAYDMLHSTYQSVIVGEIASDNTFAGGESATDVVGWQQIDLMSHTATNSNLKQIWDWMFAGVNRAAFILENKDKTAFEGREQIVAEARFLKAYYNFELVKWFGGIPLKGDERFGLGDEKTIPRSSKDEVYAAIEADLIAAIPNLSPTAPQVGRASKGAAQALLGKVYLYHAGNTANASLQTELYTKSAAAFEEVIGSGAYSLVDDFADIWEHEGENGPESIFEVQYTDAQGASFDCLQCVEGNVAVGFSGPRNYSGPLYTSGFSFNVPDDSEVASLFETGDLRKDPTLLYMPDWTAQTGASYGAGYHDTGYFNRKYIPRTRSTDAAGDLNLTNPNNYRAIRYADVLLMAAEAYNRIGNDAKAQEYLNEVRERAFGNPSHNINLAGEQLYDAILEERRRELFGEGHRFFDLVRTGRAATNIDGFVTDKHEVFPIPFEEIQFSNNLWRQNNGY